MSAVRADEWLSLAISEIAVFGSGELISVARLSTRSGANPIPVYGGNGIAGYTSRAMVDRPTVILGRVGQKCGVVNRSDGPVWITDNALYARQFKRPLDVKFLAYALDAARLNDVKNRNDLPLITQSILNDVRIAWPDSLEEQRRIARVMTNIDDLIASLERMVAKKQAIKQGMMQQLLTGKTRLPGFTGTWREILLGKHVSYVNTVALSRAQLDGESPVRYLHYGDIHTRCGVTLDAAHEAMPRASSTLLRNAGRLQIGDLVFADASEDPDGVGKSVEVTSVPDAGVVPGLHTIAARFDKAVLADGFKAYLQFIPSFRDALLRLAAGTKVLATTRSFISSITLALPDVEEQRAIASVIADVDREISIFLVRLDKARNVKQGMMQQLLTGRTRLPAKEGAA